MSTIFSSRGALMLFLAIAVIGFFASLIAFFSGFGLGTVLLPVFAIFLSPTTAVIAVAIVHGATSLLRTILLRKHVDFEVTTRFGIPAMISALIGATLLSLITGWPAFFHYEIFHIKAQISVVKLLLSLLIAGFALHEIWPKSLSKKPPTNKDLTRGGLISGFFGGLSGHQGAFRSSVLTTFLHSSSKFVSTNAAIGLMVDLARLITYAFFLWLGTYKIDYQSKAFFLVASGIIGSFIGTLIGKKFIKHISMNFIRYLVLAGMIIIALGLGFGIL
jgi:uncharacterized membrane protein YfcA